MGDQSKIVFLRGKRLVLRPVLLSDVPHLTRWINEPDTRKFLTAYLPMSEKDEENWVNSHGDRKNTNIVLMIETTEGQAIGTIGLHHIDWKNSHATTGANIGEPEFRDKGYGTEAKILLLRYAFQELNLHKVCSEVLSFNGRSRAYLEKTGYVLEGIRRKHMYCNGRYCDLAILAIFKKDFPKVWRKWKHLVV